MNWSNNNYAGNLKLNQVIVIHAFRQEFPLVYVHYLFIIFLPPLLYKSLNHQFREKTKKCCGLQAVFE